MAPAHVLTADYLGTLAEAQHCSNYAPYLSYVYPKTDQFGVWQNTCHVQGVFYVNAGQPYPSDSTAGIGKLVSGPYLNAMARTSSGALVTSYAGRGYLFDPHTSAAHAYLQAVLDGVSQYTAGYADPGVTPDLVFFDNWDDLYGVTGSPADFSSYTDWTAATASALSSLNDHGMNILVNALSVPESYSSPPSGLTWQTPIAGLAPIPAAEYEGCYDTARNWSEIEDTELTTIDEGKQFWCLANGPFTKNNTATSYGPRLFTYASFLLTYSPAAAVFQEELKTASGFEVFPESGFVPLNPVQTAHGGIGDLARGGVYVREFSACFYRGSAVGACAVVVNPSSTAQPLNLSGYSRSVVLSGSDILDGGGLSVNEPAVTVLPGDSGAILLR